MQPISDQNFDTAKEKVEHILSKVKGTIVNEKLLIVSYWLTYDDVLSCLDDMDEIPDDIKVKIIKRVARAIIEKGTVPETITRTKRKILEKYRYG